RDESVLEDCRCTWHEPEGTRDYFFRRPIDTLDSEKNLKETDQSFFFHFVPDPDHADQGTKLMPLPAHAGAMTRYRCSVCNRYTYDSEKGDPGTGILPGTEPDGFPESWKCPFCGSGSMHLKQVD
ncbi:MAG: rubredoxin, partial [Methanoregulaceae archaeon]|nr:rubredoxin [Methanoregulaceae archaeon]